MTIDEFVDLYIENFREHLKNKFKGRVSVMEQYIQCEACPLRRQCIKCGGDDHCENCKEFLEENIQ